MMANRDGRWYMSTVVILASGSSLSAEQVETVRIAREQHRCYAIAINTTYRMAPWADALYACDYTWWRDNAGGVKQLFHGERWTQDDRAAREYGLQQIRSIKAVGLSRDPAVVHQGGGVNGGGHSGYQAMNLAYHWGAVRIVLLGFDGQGGHWHEPHTLRADSPFETWRREMPAMAADLAAEGVEVVNCTPGSAYACFPVASIEEALRARPVIPA